ncbi:MAG: hypothetical protein ACREEM_25975 [Blastocatellia bacterium]
MSQRIMTMSAHIFFRLLAHAPEELMQQAKDDARRAIPALCFTEDDIRQKFVQEEGWDDLSDDEQREAIRLLLDMGEYEYAGATANQAIAEAVGNYLADSFIEKSEQQEGGSNESQ